MAKAKVVHSSDSVEVLFKGNKKSPEPSSAVIKFPGGHVEVSRTSDGKYWAHMSVNDSATVKNSRIDYQHEAYELCIANGDPIIPKIPQGDKIKHMAIMIDGAYESTETL